MALSRKEIDHRFVQRRKENGLCVRCGNPLDRDGYYCRSCCDKNNERTKKDREFYKKNGICPECRKNRIFPNEYICPECKARKTSHKKELTDKRKEQMRKHNKSTYQYRAEHGICTCCGKRKAEDGKKKCRICLDRNAYLHRKKNMDKESVREYREKNHLCYTCGKPIDVEHGKMCSSCLDRCSENGRKSSAAGKNQYWIAQNKLIFNSGKEMAYEINTGTSQQART